MSTPQSSEERLRETILNDILVHELECDLSMYGTPCDCIQKNTTDGIMHAVKAELGAALKDEMYVKDISGAPKSVSDAVIDNRNFLRKELRNHFGIGEDV